VVWTFDACKRIHLGSCVVILDLFVALFLEANKDRTRRSYTQQPPALAGSSVTGGSVVRLAADAFLRWPWVSDALARTQIMEKVWIFNGPRAQLPSVAFASKETAEKWIQQHRLSGTLTAYPIDVGVYDWAVAAEYFVPKRDEQCPPDFIQRFSSASHYHYENGQTS
jgi:hypothetical protein